MIEGIKVLNKITEMTELPSWWGIGIIIIIGLILIIGIGWSIVEDNGENFCLVLVIGIFIMVWYMIIISLNIFQTPTGEYTYQVTIDDSVNLKEFDDKYNIIEHEGEIYTIIEK